MQKGDIIEAKIVKILKTHLIVRAEGGWVGLLHVSKISDYYVSDISSLFKNGQKYYFEIVSVYTNKKKLKLSWKSIVPRFVKDPFTFQIKETKNGFKKLEENKIKEQLND